MRALVHNRRLAFSCFTAILAAAPLSIGTVAAQNTENITLRGTDLAVYNLVGRLRISGSTGSAVTATITRRGRDAGRLTVVTGSARGRESLRIIYPDDQISIPSAPGRRFRTEVRVRDDGTFGDDNNGVRFRREGRTVRISSDGRGLEAAADVELQVPDGISLRVHLAVGDAVIRNMSGTLLVDVHSADVTVSDFKGPLTLDTGSGTLTVSNVNGPMSFDTGSGDFRGTNLSGPSLNVDTGSGDVVLDGCTSDRIIMDTGSGALRATNVRTRSLTMDTGSGDVVLGLLSNFDDLQIDSGSGTVTLNLPPAFAASLDIDTGSGSITSDFPIQLTSKSRDQLVGRIGSGGGRVVIETGSGNVRLRKGA